ncbi:hypothetical protein BWP39_09385 [Paraburkholderia acidicola]|uniref:Uncharacterized protein n=1 Tax=Paraburkholderia acidicola TaxID=1912599 RepID=A0A2A4F0T3_9BURK|nr:hypothetical protein BWP39_09385 [Paraburkholderia acidicola]
MRNEASVFWPRHRTHAVSSLSLDVKNLGISSEMARHISIVLKLSDAIRDLRSLKHPGLDSLSAQLSLEAANALDDLSGLLKDRDSIRGVKSRAEILRGGNKTQLATEIANLDEQELLVFCGDLTTWLGKSRETHFSSFFAVPDHAHQRMADNADAMLPQAFQELRLMVDDQLHLTSTCRFKITNLIATAGEANLYPKHFAYFLPEDEGVKYAERKRTVVFMNTYLALFELISLEESRRRISVSDGALRTSEIGKYLIAWFRGHDVGHSVMRQETDFRAVSKVDRWASMVLQEVLADVFGFLLCSTRTWQTGLSLDSSILAEIYAFEMLRYLRRAPRDFPDAGAAFVQLQYLIDHGYATFDADTGKISLSSADMLGGMTMLAKDLSQSVLSGDVVATMAFASRYCPHLNAAALDKMSAFLGRSTRTLDYIQPIYESGESSAK